MVLPVGIEPTTSPLPRDDISRKCLKTLAAADRGGRNVPRIDGGSVGIPSVMPACHSASPASFETPPFERYLGLPHVVGVMVRVKLGCAGDAMT